MLISMRRVDLASTDVLGLLNVTDTHTSIFFEEITFLSMR